MTDIAHFEYTDVEKTWRIFTEDGAIDLMFRPLGMRQQDVDYQVLSSKFKQPFGLFEGKITYQQNTYVIQDQPGVVEEHLAVW